MADIVVTTGGNAATNGTNFQSALDAANAGDRVILTAGATYQGTFSLADKSASSGSPVTITTNAVGSLPSGRVGPSDVSNMAKVVTVGSNTDHPGAFYTTSGASYWIIDGLEITENVADTITIGALLDFIIPGNNLTVQRCYVHGKETGSDYYRSIRFACQFEGSGLTFKWNYVGPIIGYYQLAQSSPYQMIDTNCIACVGGNTLTIHDNYLDAWYVAIFFGGGDSAPQNTATITSSSTTSGTFSNVTGLAEGVIIRCDFTVTGTWDTDTNTFTRTGGATMTDADIEHRGRLTVGGLTGVYRITDTTGSNYAMVCDSGNPSIPDGSATLVMYETARVTSVAGSVVNYTPFGLRFLAQSPSAASWCYGTQGLVHTVEITKNTFNIDAAFVADAIANNGSHPKGYFEFKSAKDMLMEGNRFQGYPASLAWTGSNQNGTAPWTTTRDVIFRNNWVDSITSIIISDNQYTDTNTPSGNFTITNNVFKGTRNFLQGGNGDGSDDTQLIGFTVTHNTIFNDATQYAGGYSGIVAWLGVMDDFTFNDNIAYYLSSGMLCFVGGFSLSGDCIPTSRQFLNNVIADSFPVGINTSWWGAGSILSPIPTLLSTDVGFVDYGAENYELDVTSDYKGAGTGGSDPGVDWAALQAALGGASSDTGRKVKRGKVTRGRH